MTRSPLSQQQRRTRAVLTALLVLSLAGCASYSGGVNAGDNAGAQAGSSLSNTVAASFTNATGAPTSSTVYRIGSPDVLSIKVFQVSDLDREVTVAADGSISLPLIGRVVAAGKTTQELEKLIARRLGAKYLQSPQVAVTISKYASQRFTVEGAVKGPGVYPLSGDITLLQALATAKGLDDLASTSNVIIFRQMQGRRAAARFDVSMIRAGQLKDPKIVSGDVIVVDQSGVKTALKEVGRALPLLAVFRLF